MDIGKETFSANELRKSHRIYLPASALVAGQDFYVTNWSFDGFRIRSGSELWSHQPGEVVDVAFSPRNSSAPVAVDGQARVVWCGPSGAGLVWHSLSSDSRMVLRHFLTRSRPTPVDAEAKIGEQYEPVLSPAPKPVAAPQHDTQLVKKRRSRISGYLIAGVLLVGLIGVLAYENQFVYSTRALYPGNLSDVVATAEGIVERIEVADGDSLVPGQVVAQLESRELDEQIAATRRLVEERRNVVSISRAAVESMVSPKEMYAEVAEQQVASNRAVVAEANATLIARENDYTRALELDRSSLIGKSDLDRAKAEFERAKAHFQSVQEQLKLASKISSEAKQGRFFNGSKVDNDLQLTQVNAAQREAELSQAEVELSRLEGLRRNLSVQAKTSGVVFAVEQRPGQFVRSGQRVAVLRGTEQPWVVARFNPADAGRLNIGDTALVYGAGLPSGITAHIKALGHTELSKDHPLSSLFESQSNDIPVEFQLDDVNAQLYPGMTLEVRVKTKWFGLADKIILSRAE